MQFRMNLNKNTMNYLSTGRDIYSSTKGDIIQFLGGGGGGGVELYKILVSLAICRTLFFHTLPQEKDLFQLVLGDIYLFHILRIFLYPQSWITN